jgi:hypothetical protein
VSGSEQPTASPPHVIARNEAIKQSSRAFELNCFAESVIGRRFAPTRWLPMTATAAQSKFIMLFAP